MLLKLYIVHYFGGIVMQEYTYHDFLNIIMCKTKRSLQFKMKVRN